MRLTPIVAALLVAAPAGASVVVAESLGELVGHASLVVQGTVGRQASAWEGGHIVTRTTVSVARSLKGSAPRTVVVETLGGVVGDVGQVASGEAALTPGEEVVLLLEPAGEGWRAVGMAQGVFHVRADLSGSRVASQEVAGLAVASPGREGLQIDEAAPASLPLEDLLARIGRLVHDAGSAQRR